MTNELEIKCSHHGPSSPGVLACVHIVEGEGQGFCLLPSEPGEASEAWPDAICDACADEPEWTDAEALERMRALCKYCWEDAFARNTTVEPHADPDRWVHEARHRAAARQDRWLERFDVLRYSRYQMELEDERPWLGFGHSASQIHIRADALVIGSWSRKSKTWLWGWANDHWEARLTDPMIAVKRFGEENGLEPLWRMGGDASEEESLALASCALDLLPQLEGMYRCPGDATTLFLGVFDTRYVS